MNLPVAMETVVARLAIPGCAGILGDLFMSLFPRFAKGVVVA
jgi:hypothetical protein